MTEELTALIHSLTCPKCAGEGRLAWRTATRSGGYIAHQHNTIPCDACDTDGLSSLAKERFTCPV